MEINSGLTLDTAGSRHLEAIVQLINLPAHSYTIPTMISNNGKLLLPLIIVVPDAIGEFGTRVKKNLFQAQNIYFTSSKSGKLTEGHLKTWLKDVFFPNFGNNSILLVDSSET